MITLILQMRKMWYPLMDKIAHLANGIGEIWTRQSDDQFFTIRNMLAFLQPGFEMTP